MSNTERPVANPGELTAAPVVQPLPGVAQPAVTPVDVRQARFGIAMRGFDRTEVTTFLLATADAYEQALRENERLRQELRRLEASVQQSRELEGGMRTMLLSAQKVADDMRERAQQDAERVVRDAEGRADEMAQKARAELEDVQREIDGLHAKKREAEASLESTIASLQRALEFIRALPGSPAGA